METVTKAYQAFMKWANEYWAKMEADRDAAEKNRAAYGKSLEHLVATEMAKSPQMQQMVRVYRGRNLDKDFRHDADRLAKEGWMVRTQAYGGTRGPGILNIFLWGIFAFGGKRRASELTVVYAR